MKEQIPIIIKNQHELLNLLSQGYGTLSRTLMEYIDNSFDSADDFFDEDKYIKDVIITIKIDRNKKSILITDNCVGMDKQTLKRLANEINNSNKKDKKRSWVNGTFGLGAHAYRLFAGNLTVTSKQKNGKQTTIYIEKSNSEATLSDDTEETIFASGTVVEVGDIDRNELKNLTVTILKGDIETHFEMLLKRNVTITIFDEGNQVKCEPFAYDAIEGIPLIKTFTSWENRGTKITVPDNKAVTLNLKVCKQSINRPVYFTSRGRRIDNVLELKSFNNYVINNDAKHRKTWSNFLLTGYIDVKDNLKPVVHRNDFENNAQRTAIYAEIMKFNDEIFEAIQQEMQNKTDEGMKTLGSALTDILSKLAREDSMNLRKIDETGNKKNINNEDEIPFKPDEDSDIIFTVKDFNDDNPNPHPPDPEPNPRTKEIPGIPDQEGGETGIPNQPKKRGMQIEFMSMGSEERATYSDGVIYIFTDHQDFQERVGRTHGGELSSMKITARLANYLAAIISSKYKEQFYQQKKLEPERDKILDEQIDFIFRFENLMKDFIDQRLDKIGEIK